MPLEQEVLLVAVCKLTFEATSTRALSQRGVTGKIAREMDVEGGLEGEMNG